MDADRCACRASRREREKKKRGQKEILLMSEESIEKEKTHRWLVELRESIEKEERKGEDRKEGRKEEERKEKKKESEKDKKKKRQKARTNRNKRQRERYTDLFFLEEKRRGLSLDAFSLSPLSFSLSSPFYLLCSFRCSRFPGRKSVGHFTSVTQLGRAGRGTANVFFSLAGLFAVPLCRHLNNTWGAKALWVSAGTRETQERPAKKRGACGEDTPGTPFAVPTERQKERGGRGWSKLRMHEGKRESNERERKDTHALGERGAGRVLKTIERIEEREREKFFLPPPPPRENACMTVVAGNMRGRKETASLAFVPFRRMGGSNHSSKSTMRTSIKTVYKHLLSGDRREGGREGSREERYGKGWLGREI